MGQSATLYRISQIEFDLLLKDPGKFNPRMTDGQATFEQNFEGIIFLLSKLSSSSEQALIHEIFYPIDSVGKNIDFDSANFDIGIDLTYLKTESVSYLSHEKVNEIKAFLNRINKEQLLNSYNPDELNDNGIYPTVWHSNESPNQAFNRKHIEAGFDQLVTLFNDAVNSKNQILTFVG